MAGFFLMDLPNFKNLTYKNIKIVYERNQVWLYKDNNLLTYECLKNFNDLNTFQLHFDIAYGHCVTAGLGLLITESTLLSISKVIAFSITFFTNRACSLFLIDTQSSSCICM